MSPKITREKLVECMSTIYLLNIHIFFRRRACTKKNDGGRNWKETGEKQPQYQLTQGILIGVQCIFGLGDALSLVASFEQSKQHSKGATRIKISLRKREKWMHSLTTVPVPCSEIPFTSGKSTNFSFIVLGSLCEFCPKIDISVK